MDPKRITTVGDLLKLPKHEVVEVVANKTIRYQKVDLEVIQLREGQPLSVPAADAKRLIDAGHAEIPKPKKKAKAAEQEPEEDEEDDESEDEDGDGAIDLTELNKKDLLAKAAELGADEDTLKAWAKLTKPELLAEVQKLAQG